MLLSNGRGFVHGVAVNNNQFHIPELFLTAFKGHESLAKKGIIFLIKAWKNNTEKRFFVYRHTISIHKFIFFNKTRPMENRKKEVAKILLQKECLKLSPENPYTYASGLKGPMYCDNRKILSYPKERTQIVEAFCDQIKFFNLDFQSLCGLATGGIPHGALVADRLEKPFIYARSKPKAYGACNQIEGHYELDDKTILIEDLVNQGTSLEEAVKGIRREKINPVLCLSIVDYQMKKSSERIKKLELNFSALTDFDHILAAALELKLIQPAEEKVLRTWQEDPENWI